jgi:molybdopterin converting factor small subunit
MMQVTVKYLAQVRHAAGVPAETLCLDRPCTLQQLLMQLAERHGEPFRRLLDATGRSPSLLFFVGDEQVRWDACVELRDGDLVTVLSPIAGG